MSEQPRDASEKAVKVLLENHRLLLTLVGFFIAGLFAYAGRGTNVLEPRYFWAQGCFIVAGACVVLAVSVAIGQAQDDEYNAFSLWMTIPYGIALLLICTGLFCTALFLLWPPPASQPTSPSGPAVGIRIDGAGAVIGPDTKLRLKIQYDSSGQKIQVIEIMPP